LRRRRAARPSTGRGSGPAALLSRGPGNRSGCGRERPFGPRPDRLPGPWTLRPRPLRPLRQGAALDPATRQGAAPRPSTLGRCRMLRRYPIPCGPRPVTVKLPALPECYALPCVNKSGNVGACRKGQATGRESRGRPTTHPAGSSGGWVRANWRRQSRRDPGSAQCPRLASREVPQPGTDLATGSSTETREAQGTAGKQRAGQARGVMCHRLRSGVASNLPPRVGAIWPPRSDASIERSILKSCRHYIRIYRHVLHVDGGFASVWVIWVEWGLFSGLCVELSGGGPRGGHCLKCALRFFDYDNCKTRAGLHCSTGC
jgi:hypothetical protein